jgi:radical SAM protein with 4Fe4S-binding SPASM domain
VTNRCNLRCKQCSQWGVSGVYKEVSNDLLSSELSAQQWKDFIGQISQKSFFCPHIHFFGGEPFVRKDIIELIEYASRQNIITGVNTNGTLLDGKAPEIVDSGLDYMIISLDGPESINNKIRVGQGNVYKKILEGLYSLLSEKKKRKTFFPIIELCFTLTHENQHYIYETAKIAHDLGVDAFLIQFGIFTTEELGRISSGIIKTEFGYKSTSWKGYISDKSLIDISTIKEQVNKTRIFLGDRYNQLPHFHFDISEYFNCPEKVLGNKKCFVGWLSAHVMPNGNVATCDEFPDIVAGNILENDFQDIWQNQIYAAFRRIIKKRGTLPFCSRCCSLYECDIY